MYQDIVDTFVSGHRWHYGLIYKYFFTIIIVLWHSICISFAVTKSKSYGKRGSIKSTCRVSWNNSFEELCSHAQEFFQTHNQEHHYSTMGHKTPAELDPEQACFIKPLSPDYQLCERPPLDSGNLNEIRFIRLVRSDLTINVLNTVIPVKKELLYTYVEAVLLVNEHRLLLRHDNQVVQSVEFVMPLC